MTKLRFRMKRGMGLHYLRREGGEVAVRPGDIVECTREELGSALHKFDQLDPDPPPPEPSVRLRAVHSGGGKWDVVNEVTKKKINEKPLNKQQALDLVDAIEPHLRPDPDPGEENKGEGGEEK